MVSPEMERIKRARRIILDIIEKRGRDHLYDLTGMGGGFNLKKSDMDILDTYIGPAIFSERLNNVGLQHLGGDPDIHRAVGFNRTTSAILSTLMALSKDIEEVVHYLPRRPSHPSIPRGCKLLDLPYFESDEIEEVVKRIDENTLTVVTGATMDHRVVDLEHLREILSRCRERNSISFVDDASGARLRLIYNQPPALKLGANLVVTSTDKLMDGPRAGILAGDRDLVDTIYEEGLKYGLEAQAPMLAGMVNALENFSLQKLREAFERARRIDLTPLISLGIEVERRPTGFALTSLSEEESVELALKLLERYGIITIPAVGMPGASKILRIDLCSKDAYRISDHYIINALVESYKELKSQ
ncbi:TIGR03576 family pyridoxal phosphate-dependent enzyme [Methanothermococcus sp. SCGC AD-155-E23]|nr:TIGR03576 family pyridoxal phosphate-dependent enzyme [Methanothermococcus sp. SCGC AD-155-E23]